MRLPNFFIGIALAACSSAAGAVPFVFDSDPFAGSTALTTPGRQIVGGEPSITFSIASDLFMIDPVVFNTGTTVFFINDVEANLPASGVNVVVLQTLDNDANPATPFGAGNAANLIAARLSAPGPGFFIYFNSGLDLPRLVYSTDLSDNTADLKIIARMTNFSGQSGVLPQFTAANFVFASVPEPSTLLLMGAGGVLASRRKTRALAAC